MLVSNILRMQAVKKNTRNIARSIEANEEMKQDQ